MVRPGIGLYGGYATKNPGQEDIKTVVTLLAPILQIRNIKKGDTLGYDATYTAPRDMQIAVLGAGYADGIPVLASNKGYATLHDEAVPIVGRVSMDITMVDITNVHMHKEVGGVVVFRGDQLENEAREIVSAQVLAKALAAITANRLNAANAFLPSKGHLPSHLILSRENFSQNR